MPTRLDPHRHLLRQQVLPRYEELGSLDFAYMQGSLVSGYTDRADLDLILVWDQPEVPADRERIVARLDQRRLAAPFVVDYQDVHLEQLVIADQEYNVAHQTVAQFQGMVRAVLEGREHPTQVLDPLTAVSGFYYGERLADRAGHGEQTKAALRQFPPTLKSETARRARGHREATLTHLRTFAERADWFMFHKELVEAVHMVLLGLDPRVLTTFDRLWERDGEPADRIAALTQLHSLLDQSGSA